MDQFNYGRVLMGDSLGFHIIFALLGVGIPFIISLFELLAIIKKDKQYYLAAKRWSFSMAVLFVVGAISGTIISFQLNALWPTFMALTGKVIGLPFYLETFAFFIEAIFLGIYLYSWNRFSPIVHWLCSLPIVIASAASGFFITSANAWMNSPQGFDYIDGVASNIDPLKAMFNPATFTETTHSISSYYLTSVLFFAGLYAVFLMKKNLPEAVKNYYQKIIIIMMVLGLIFALAVGITGDSSAKFLARHEPLKLAAAEHLENTQAHAPLKIGKSLTIPGLLSFLAFGRTDAVVKGLNEFDPKLWPPLWIHYMFDYMVLIGIYLTLIPVLFLIFNRIKKSWAFSKLMLIGIFLSGIGGFFAVEFGWILTEVGRQPYAIYGIMTTKEAFTTSPNVAVFGFIFPTLYLALFVLTPWILIRHFKKDKLTLP